MTESPAQDIIHRFSFDAGPVRGQWVRLTGVLAEIASNQSYPDNVSGLLAEMLAAVALVADGIKFEGAVALQSRGPGPLTTVLAECRSRHLLRGIARWRDEAPSADVSSLKDLLGDGQLALTLIPEHTDSRSERAPYQGMVGLIDQHLAGNLERYFRDSEQLPTLLRFASDGHSVTGLLLQRLPDADYATEIELDQAEAFWEEIGILTATVTEAELAESEPGPAAVPPLCGTSADASATSQPGIPVHLQQGEDPGYSAGVQPRGTDGVAGGGNTAESSRRDPGDLRNLRRHRAFRHLRHTHDVRERNTPDTLIFRGFRALSSVDIPLT